MNRIAAYIDPTPAKTLRKFAQLHARFLDAEAQFNRDAAALPQDENHDDCFDRLEEPFARLVAKHGDAEGRAVAAILDAGAGVNRGGVQVDGLLFILVQGLFSEQAEVVILDMAEFRNLDRR